MECNRCDKWLKDNEIVYDYIGNEYCKECLDEETNRKIVEPKNDSRGIVIKAFDIQGIKEITPPTFEEFEKMNLEEAKQWRDKLYPYYYCRSEILDELGFEEWQKVIIWTAFYKRVEDLGKI